MKPNLIERLEEALAMCESLRNIAGDIVTEPLRGRIETETDNVEGVIGEILTLVDGR